MQHRIAVASTDGKVINQHFGHADRYHILDISEAGHTFVETRESPPVCGPQGHSNQGFDGVIALLADCQGIFVSRIGPGASGYMKSKGVLVFEAPYPIENVISKIIKGNILEKYAPERREPHVTIR